MNSSLLLIPHVNRTPPYYSFPTWTQTNPQFTTFFFLPRLLTTFYFWPLHFIQLSGAKMIFTEHKSHRVTPKPWHETLQHLPMLVQFSHSVMSNSLWPHELQLPCPWPSPGFAQTHVHGVGDAIQPLHPLLSPSLPSIFSASGSFSMSQFFTLRC